MPGWHSQPLEECIERVKYEAKIPRSEFLEAASYPIVSQEADFINGFWDKSADLFRVDRPVVVFGDHTQVLKYIDFDFVIGADGVKVLKPKLFLHPKYFYYFLRSVHLKRLGYARHYRLLAKIQVNYPSLPEQMRIAVILDEAFESIATAVTNAEKNLANSRELFESYLESMFINKGEDWITEALGTNVRFIDYRGKTPPKRDIGIRLITAKNVKMGFIQRAPEEFVDPSAYDAWMTRGFPRKGDVLFTTEAPLGNVAQLDTDETVIIGQRLITFQPNSQVMDRTFLKFALMSPPIQQEIFKRKSGATVSGIKASLLKQVSIHFPKKISEQVETAARIGEVSEACQRVESIYLQKLNALEELKQAILQKAFAEGLTARDMEVVQEAAE